MSNCAVGLEFCSVRSPRRADCSGFLSIPWVAQEKLLFTFTLLFFGNCWRWNKPEIIAPRSNKGITSFCFLVNKVAQTLWNSRSFSKLLRRFVGKLTVLHAVLKAELHDIGIIDLILLSERTLCASSIVFIRVITSVHFFFCFDSGFSRMKMFASFLQL